jgi:ubiquinone biosynthesis UbiH/UbiF/VisC/COQ6 family hydroxylase
MDVDIAIVGGGLVGAGLAAALAPSPFSVAVLEGAVSPGAESTGWDTRIYALSEASRKFLATWRAWNELDASRIAVIDRMLVWGDRGERLEFSAHDSGFSHLAWMVEGGALTRALWAVLERQGRAVLKRGARPQALLASDRDVTLSLGNGEVVRARLVVGADGAHSFVREQAGIDAEVKSYHQSGVVANFACERPHRNTAFQWFRNDGVLAWLPLPGQRMSMVWSTPGGHAAELLALAPEELCRRVAEAGGQMLGSLSLLAPPSAFPLALMHARGRVRPRVALVGDAALTVHPLAGHGANLGFADAACLAQVLCAARPGADPGERLLLRRYERARAGDIMLMRTATDGLARLFGDGSRVAGWARNTGLAWVNRATPLKNLMARHAAGM